jgi:uncharacterized protein (TIGR02217 family)
MSFHEVLFPVDISYGASGGPMYSTSVTMSDSGFEQRNINWAQSRLRWEVVHAIKTDEQMRELIEFFRARKGKAYGFRFKDWSDYTAVDQPASLITGETRKFQCRKQYVSGPRTEVREIKKLADGTVKVKDGATETANFTVDNNTGIISLGFTPVNQVTTSFEFHVPCRFDTDSMDFSLDFFNTSTWSSVPIVELRV